MNVYWQVSPDLVIGATEKAGYTSISRALSRCLRMSSDMVRQRNLRARLYLRHPIKRFASAYAYFTGNGHWPRGYPQFSSVEDFTDAVCSGLENEHWLPQLAQHHLIFDEVHRFENIAETWPWEYPLQHLNASRGIAPEITYRLGDLENYYKEDLQQWRQTT